MPYSTFILNTLYQTSTLNLWGKLKIVGYHKNTFTHSPYRGITKSTVGKLWVIGCNVLVQKPCLTSGFTSDQDFVGGTSDCYFSASIFV